LFKSPRDREKPPSGFGSREAAPSILSGDLKITGDVVGGGELVVAGAVQGDITAKKITIAEGGSVTGAVEAEVALVAGMLTGQLKAANVTLASTARVVADITHIALSIESGAVFEGYSRRVDNMDQASAAPQPAGRATVTPISVSKVSTPADDDMTTSATAS
jgi:cytoskeletal protein CcmA (bactofilin family)